MLEMKMTFECKSCRMPAKVTVDAFMVAATACLHFFFKQLVAYSQLKVQVFRAPNAHFYMAMMLVFHFKIHIALE